MFPSINPFTEKQISVFPVISRLELQKKIKRSDKAFALWSRMPIKQKTQHILECKKAIETELPSLAKLITREMGKPLSQARAELKKCQSLCDWGIKRAPTVLKDRHQLPLSPPGSFITHQPLGVILGIMPWNFPFWQVFRFALPALLSGNTVLVKHAPNVMGCARQLERLFKKAGFPSGVYQNIAITPSQCRALIANPVVKGVSLTGSVEAGSQVARVAGQYIKKCILELGGSDPYIVLDDADLELASSMCVSSRMNNNGQSCIAAKRWIVTKKSVRDFTDLVSEKLNAFRMGDPLLKQTTLGPLARKDIQKNLSRQVRSLIKRGGEILLGGTLPKRRGFFYPPTLLKIPSNLPVEEELFGPAALLIPVKDEKQALRTANQSPYGLGGAIFSQDCEKAAYLAGSILQAGAVAINSGLHSHPALPFGGIKNSGFGKELSDHGFYEFINLKTVVPKRH